MTVWYICTERLTRGGTKVMGPFLSRDEALNTRSLLETLRRTTYWIDAEEFKSAQEGEQ